VSKLVSNVSKRFLRRLLIWCRFPSFPKVVVLDECHACKNPKVRCCLGRAQDFASFWQEFQAASITRAVWCLGWGLCWRGFED
jgi:hypothetical protein